MLKADFEFVAEKLFLFFGNICGQPLIAIKLRVITERDNIVSLFKCLYLMAGKSELFQ